eukprot:7240960-Prymnesium_polylepis.1
MVLGRGPSVRNGSRGRRWEKSRGGRQSLRKSQFYSDKIIRFTENRTPARASAVAALGLPGPVVHCPSC